MIKKLASIFFVVMLLPLIIPAHGDGLASEILPPSMIGNKNVTLSINSSPFLVDNFHTGTQVNFVLMDVTDQQPIPQATIAVSAFRGDKAIFGHVFMSDNGNFLLDLIPDQTASKISINEDSGIFQGMLGHSGSYKIQGPDFTAGGLYKFKIEVLTMGAYNNQVSKSYNAAISIPETTQYLVDSKDYGKQNVTVIAYYDQIKNFQYDSDKKSMMITMPFDWSKNNIDSLSVVHQEIKIPRSFGDFIVTKYDGTVNGIKISDRSISIDDYSSTNERIVHLILYKEEVAKMTEKQQSPKPEMDFVLSPSNSTSFPIVQFTRNAQYKVSLSWDPPTILPGSTTRFSFNILDPYLINKTAGATKYDFSIIEGNNGLVFHNSGTTNDDGRPTSMDVKLPTGYTGPVTIAFENLGGSSFASTEYPEVVSILPAIPEFPTGVLISLIISISLVLVLPRIIKI